MQADPHEVEHARAPLVRIGERGRRFLRDKEDGPEGVEVGMGRCRLGRA